MISRFNTSLHFATLIYTVELRAQPTFDIGLEETDMDIEQKRDSNFTT